MIPIHTDDLLEKLDRALAQPYIPPATNCGACGDPLRDKGPSLDFCDDLCQGRWMGRQAAGPMVDRGRGRSGPSDYPEMDCPCCADEREQWVAMGLARAYEAHVRFIGHEYAHAERQFRERRVPRVSFELPPQPVAQTYRDRVLVALSRWMGLDPNS